MSELGELVSDFGLTHFDNQNMSQGTPVTAVESVTSSVEHQIGQPFDSKYPWVLFLDAQGVMRAAANCRDTKIHTKVAKWSLIYRGR